MEEDGELDVEGGVTTGLVGGIDSCDDGTGEAPAAGGTGWTEQ